MRRYLHVLAPALLGVAVFGLAGCGDDNETKAMKLAPGGSGPADAGKAAPPARDMTEYSKQQQQQQRQQQSGLKKAGYPGAR